MKNMYLRIRKEDGRVLISAPHQVGRQRIEQFARERIDWIREYREKYEAQSRERAAEPQPDDAEIEKRKTKKRQEKAQKEEEKRRKEEEKNKNQILKM